MAPPQIIAHRGASGHAPANTFAGQRVPTLDEVLGLSGEADVGLYLRIRCPFSVEFGVSLIRAARDVGALNRVVVVSSDPIAIEALRKLDDAVATGILIEAPHADPVAQAARCGASQLCLRE